MIRGAVVTVALQGDYGKPRPALVVQSGLFSALPSVVVLPITSTIRDVPLYRITLKPDHENGLQKTSQIMVDKPQAISCEKIGQQIGTIDDGTMLAVNRALAVFLGIA